jgi:hypothetical protein
VADEPMNPCKIWIDQCEATRTIEDEFGTDKALEYLVGETFLNFLAVAENDPDSVHFRHVEKPPDKR